MEKRLIFQQLKRLTGSARRALVEAMGSHDFADEIRRGVAQLWKVEPARLFLVTRIERRELVICCAAGREMIAASIYLIAAAKQQGLTSVRIHTRKPALVRLIKKHFPAAKLAEQREQGEQVLRMVI